MTVLFALRYTSGNLMSALSHVESDLRLSAKNRFRNTAIHDDISERGKRPRCTDGEYSHESTAPCALDSVVSVAGRNGDYPLCHGAHP